METPDVEQRKRRVEELDLKYELLEEVLELAVADAKTCTKFDAPGAYGYMLWTRSNRYLAERLTPEWESTQRDCVPRVIHPSGSHAVTAVSGSGGVGDLEKGVRSKNNKGEANKRLVNTNDQAVLLTREEILGRQDVDDIPTWYLLYKEDRQGMHAELSLPVHVNSNDYVDTWYERLPLPLPNMGSQGPEVEVDRPLDPDNDETTVPVKYLGGESPLN